MTHYFDYAATAPLYEEALDAMQPYLVPGLAGMSATANANSLHSPGRDAFAAMESARRRVAKALGARRPDEVIFTGSATESDNAALIGMFRGAMEQRRKAGRPVEHPRVVVSAIEHEAILQPAHYLIEQGIDVITIQPNRDGFIMPDRLSEALDANDVLLVSVMMANSEIGSIQPIAELCERAHKAGALFHTDAVQALGKMPIDLQALGVDAASFSAHKIGGPKGVGVLYLKARTPFRPYLLGGGQEQGRRSSTQNVCGMAACAAVAELAQGNQPSETRRLAAIRDTLYERLTKHPRIKATVPAQGSDRYLPNIVHVMVEGMESETLILRMDKLGFCVSGGSACSSHSLESSHVLRSMGVADRDARGALRLSMGRYTTVEEVDMLVDALFASID